MARVENHWSEKALGLHHQDIQTLLKSYSISFAHLIICVLNTNLRRLLSFSATDPESLEEERVISINQIRASTALSCPLITFCIRSIQYEMGERAKVDLIFLS